MTDHISVGLVLAIGVLFQIVLIYLIVRSRYRKYTSRDYILYYRNGELIREGRGGAHFILPLIDEVVTIPTAEQRVDFGIDQAIVFKPNFEEEEFDRHIKSIRITGFLTYEITNFKIFYEKSSTSLSEQESNGQELLVSTNTLLKDVIESKLKEGVLDLPLDKLYRNRELLLKEVNVILNDYSERLSLNVNDLKISNFDLIYSETD